MQVLIHCARLLFHIHLDVYHAVLHFHRLDCDSCPIRSRESTASATAVAEIDLKAVSGFVSGHDF
jgi:hypothetical protein